MVQNCANCRSVGRALSGDNSKFEKKKQVVGFEGEREHCTFSSNPTTSFFKKITTNLEFCCYLTGNLKFEYQHIL